MASVTTTPTADRIRQWVPLGLIIVAFLYSAAEVFALGARHNDGVRISGVGVAALATLAGAISIWLVASNARRTLISSLVLILWAIVTIGGIGGTIAHVQQSVPGSLVAAPLTFTVVGVIGGVSLWYDQFRRLRRTDP
jgi:hypothetical protein